VRRGCRGDVRLQAGDADRGRVADEQGPRVARVSLASLADVGPAGHFPGAIRADSQLAAADEAPDRGSRAEAARGFLVLAGRVRRGLAVGVR
jgi:hypothetical protein